MGSILQSFAAFSLAGTLLLSLLPGGAMRRTSAMVIGLLTLLFWTERLLSILPWAFDASVTTSVLSSTSISLEAAALEAAASLENRP